VSVKAIIFSKILQSVENKPITIGAFLRGAIRAAALSKATLPIKNRAAFLYLLEDSVKL